MIEALKVMIKDLPAKMVTLTLDQGAEIAEVHDFEIDSRVKAYLAHPNSPWKRRSNERYNRFIREHFPKGTVFTCITDEEVQQAKDEINNRPRVVLNGMTPHEKLTE